MLLGIFLFGWSVTELMLFYWIEPLVSILLKGYLNIYMPLKINTNEAIKKKLWQWIFAFILIIIAQGISLYGIISINALAEKPMLWTWDWIVLLALLSIMYIMPIYAQKQQGFIPIAENMPLQTKILCSNIQLFSSYIILAITLAGLYFNKTAWICLVFLVLSKMSIEIILFYKLKKKLYSPKH